MFNRHTSGDAARHPHPFAVSNSTCPDGTVRVSLHGELDVATAPTLVEAIDELRRNDAWFVLDLRKLHFMDSTGLRVVIRVSREVSAGGRTMRVIRGPDLVQKVLEVTGADEMVEYVDP